MDWFRPGSRGGFNEAAEGPENGEADSRTGGGDGDGEEGREGEWRQEQDTGERGSGLELEESRTAPLVRRAGICFRMEVRFGQMLLVLGANKTTVEFLIPLCQCTLRLTAA